jgi:hypothetical protein
MPERPKRYAKCYSLEYNTVNNTTTCKRVITNQVTEKVIIRLNTSDGNETQKVIEAAQSPGARAIILGYALNNPDKAIADARKKSLEDARLRAEDYAAAYGFKLGKSIEIEEIRYPGIEIGPSYGWDRPMRMHHHRFRGNRFPMMDRFYGFEGSYIPAGMADVTAYTRVTYEVS